MDRALHSADELDADRRAAPTAPPRYRSFALAPRRRSALLLFFAIPVAIFVVYSFLTGATFSFTLETPSRSTTTSTSSRRPSTDDLLLNSAIVGLSVGVVCLLIGIPFAYWVRYHAGRFQRLILLSVIAAMFASYLVRIYAWRTMLGATA